VAEVDNVQGTQLSRGSLRRTSTAATAANTNKSRADTTVDASVATTDSLTSPRRTGEDHAAQDAASPSSPGAYGVVVKGQWRNSTSTSPPPAMNDTDGTEPLLRETNTDTFVASALFPTESEPSTSNDDDVVATTAANAVGDGNAAAAAISSSASDAVSHSDCEQSAVTTSQIQPSPAEVRPHASRSSDRTDTQVANHELQTSLVHSASTDAAGVAAGAAAAALNRGGNNNDDETGAGGGAAGATDTATLPATTASGEQASVVAGAGAPAADVAAGVGAATTTTLQPPSHVFKSNDESHQTPASTALHAPTGAHVPASATANVGDCGLKGADVVTVHQGNVLVKETAKFGGHPWRSHFWRITRNEDTRGSGGSGGGGWTVHQWRHAAAADAKTSPQGPPSVVIQVPPPVGGIAVCEDDLEFMERKRGKHRGVLKLTVAVSGKSDRHIMFKADVGSATQADVDVATKAWRVAFASYSEA
jgi:hypothetical protein